MRRIEDARFENDGSTGLLLTERYGEFVTPEFVDLPIVERKAEIADAIRDNQVLIVVGETGSGKSTQLPKIGLEMGFDRIEHTQPRRIAAMEVIARIGAELRMAMPDIPADITGYHTAEKNTTTENTRITEYTDGLQLVREMHRRPTPGSVLHIVDEVHEKNKNIDMLLGWYKTQLASNPDMRVVITSATVDAEKYQTFFGEVTVAQPPIIEISGRTYPITYLEEPNSDVVEQMLRYAKPGAGLLVFQQGKREISDVISDFKRQLPSNLRSIAKIYPLHSKLSSDEQRRACESEHKLKVVVATNVAQTSLTISGITHVIGDGLARQTDIDKRGREGLFSRPISQSAMRQQGGRGGRLGPGVHIHTRKDANTEFISLEQRPEFDTSEILRSDISRMMLRTAAIGLDFRSWPLPEEVPVGRIDHAERSLCIVGAIDEDGDITSIGSRMDKYPVSPQLGRMLVEAEQSSQDIQVMVAAIAAVIETGGLPLYEKFASTKWREVAEETTSDLLMQLELFTKLRNHTDDELRGVGIDAKNFRRSEETFAKICRLLSVDAEGLVLMNDTHRPELLHCVYAGYIEHIYKRVGRTTFNLISKPGDTTDYELSNRSVVSDGSDYVLGTPYQFERKIGGEMTTVNVVESVTRLDGGLSALGRLAAGLTSWQPGPIEWRNGHPVMCENEIIAGVLTHNSREVAAIPSEELRTAIISYALEHPGSAQLHLRKTKKELEQLNHRAIGSVPQISTAELVELVNRAAPEGITSPQDIEANLWQIIYNENLLPGKYVGEKDRDEIDRSTPPTVEIMGQTCAVEYRNHHAIIERSGWELCRQLPDNFCLPDDREVRFRYEGHIYTIAGLKKKLNK